MDLQIQQLEQKRKSVGKASVERPGNLFGDDLMHSRRHNP